MITNLYVQIKPYQYYLLGILVLLFFGLTSNRSVVEGFDGLDSEKYAPAVKNSHIKIMDSLNVSKYRANYEDIIKNKIKWCDSQLLAHVLSDKLDLDDPTTTKNTTHINQLNNIQTFKDTLTNSLKYMNNQ
jgi:hypothetical protein